MADTQTEMMELNPSDLKQLLVRCFKRDKNLFIWGPPGVGKTVITRTTAADLGAQYLPLHLTLMEPVDLRGMPVVNAEHTAVHWVPMGELPTDPDSIGIIHLDELNTADPSVMAAAMQFCLERRIGEYVLPKGWRIVACGNRAKDGAAARRMPTALADRFSHVELLTNVDSWTEWAIQNGIVESLIAFINFRPDMLHNFSTQRTVNTSPRGWGDVNDMLVDDPNMDEMSTIAYASGRVGSGPITELRAFIRVWGSLPDIDKILSGEITTLKDHQDPAVKYAVAIALAMNVKKGQMAAMLDFLDKIGPEFSRMSLFMALKRDPRVRTDAGYQDWVANRMSRVSS